MPKPVLVRVHSVKTSAWITAQAEGVRKCAGRAIGAGPLIESICNGLVEARVTFEDCAGMSDVAAKVARLINARFAPTKEVR